MGIGSFIQAQILQPRLRDKGVLVVYDPDRRYRDLCLGMAADTVCVVDAGGSSIESREAAMAAFRELGRPTPAIEGLLVYVPAKPPLCDEDRQRDPFALYATCGSVFPEGDGDEYQSLCLKAKPDLATEVRRVFAQDPNPSFAVIDAIGGGAGWPTLQALLKVESARDILYALLAPSDAQKTAMAGQDAWIHEAKELVQSCLALKLMTRSKAWSTVAGELWRYLLFSEFVFDLPEPLPEALAGVPRAPVEARPLVEDLCERLRHDRRAQTLYLQRAEEIERGLDLPAHCRAIRNLGIRDTFPFEERSFLSQALEALTAGDMDTARAVVGRHSQSIWLGKGESQAQWGLVRAALELVAACEDGGRQLPDHARSLDALIDYYLRALREVDRRHREFEQAANDCVDPENAMATLVAHARGRYGQVAAEAQEALVRHVERAGWPPPGRLGNAAVFDQVVAPRLKESGKKVALVLVDALRYELGATLAAQVGDDGKVELSAAFAQLPTVTPVGMASLLPGAMRALDLCKDKDGAVPVLDGQALPGVSQRMEVLRRLYGERFAETTLSDFLKSPASVAPAVELLVLRSAEIDAQLESHPESALGLIHDTFRRIRVAVHRLKTMCFDAVVIVTDHGFLLNTHAGPGDVARKPPGTWLLVHDRALLGAGTADAANCVMPAAQAGIRGDFAQFATPRGLVPYRAGQLYLHGGLSLQEAVVPVLTLQLSRPQAPDLRQATIELTYRQGLKAITTRLPVLDVRVTQADLFAAGSEFEILIEAHDRKGNVVGEAKPGGPVNPATGTVTLRPGEHLQVALRMDLEFEGKFSVKALNPTTLAAYAKLDLETDYPV